MRSRVRAGLALTLLLALAIGGALVRPRLPGIVRAAALSRIEAATGRPATMDSLALDLWTGALAVRGFRLLDHDGQPLGTIGRLDARLRLASLLLGHLRLRELVVHDSTVRVVRREDGEFNIADMIGPGGDGGRLDVTVDRFQLTGGTVVLEDRTLTPARVWRSEDIRITGRNVSTRRDDGEADGSTVLDGAPVTVRVEGLRLYPIHLRATVQAREVDLGVAGLYLPASVPVALDRGRLETTVSVALDARAGLRVDVDGRIADAVLVRRPRGDPVLVAPAVRLAVRDFTVSTGGALAVGRVELDGASTLVNSEASPPARFELPRVRAWAEGLAWPVRGPAWVEVFAPVPGGGQLSVKGSVHAAPASADLDVSLSRVNLAPWARYVAPGLRVTGTGEVALGVRATLQPALSAVAGGGARVSRLVVAEGGRRLLALERGEVSGLEVQWPSRVAIGHVRLRRPDAVVVREASGRLALPALGPPASPGAVAPGGGSRSTPSPLRLAVGQLTVEQGALTWRDLAVAPPATVRLAGVRLVARDAAWPVAGPVPVELRAATPGGGVVEVSGRVGVEPLAAAVQVRARDVALAPYGAYLPGRLPVAGRASATLDVTLARGPALQARVRGEAALAGLAMTDGRRRVLSAERVQARGLDVEWPGRVGVERLALRRPWVLVEREADGTLPLRAMLGPAAGGAGTTPAAGPGPGASSNPPAAGPAGAPGEGWPAVTVGELRVVDGGARVVDRAISPPYAEDLSRVSLRLRGLATASEQPARLEATAAIGPGGTFGLRGRVRPLGEPFVLDLTGELSQLAMTRLNPYLQHFAGWAADQGRASNRLAVRVDGDQLQARNDIQLSRLHLVRVATDEAGRERIGLPLGLVVALLKDRRGEIRLPLAVGGRLSDPRFDLGEAVWSAVRTVAVKAISLPLSWIGRLRYTADARIEDVEIDPVPFQGGAATAGADAGPRLQRLAEFMHRRPDVRLALTPVVSLGDLEVLETRAIRARARALAAERRLPEPDALRHLFVQQYPDRTPPADPEALLAALREVEEPPELEAAALARQRADVVRQSLTAAGVAPARLTVSRDPAAQETLEAGGVEFALTEARRPRRPLADLLRQLVEAVRRRLAELGRGRSGS